MIINVINRWYIIIYFINSCAADEMHDSNKYLQFSFWLWYLFQSKFLSNKKNQTYVILQYFADRSFIIISPYNTPIHATHHHYDNNTTCLAIYSDFFLFWIGIVSLDVYSLLYAIKRKKKSPIRWNSILRI